MKAKGSGGAVLTAAALAEAECANYVQGLCLGSAPCVLMEDQRCRYFETAVLPLHPNLRGYELATTDPAEKRCAACGEVITAASRHTLYCQRCAERIRRDRARLRKKRQRRGDVTLFESGG